MRMDRRTIVELTMSGVALASSAAAASCFLVVWMYWYYELDVDCWDRRDCKCVLFGTSVQANGRGGGGGGFVGGERTPCRYVLYSTLASAGLAACAFVHYGCRALLCSYRRYDQHRPVQQEQSSGRPDIRSQISGLKMCYVIILGLMALNMLISSIVLSNGYISTCLQYVHRVKSYLMVSGNMVELISNRMSCGTIYDFLDYLQPPSRQVTYELIHRHKTNPRDYVINTSLLLIISIIMSWLTTSIWIVFTFCVYYFK